MSEMDEKLSNITSFVNTDWILSLCEQEIQNERMIHEGIGGRINMIAQAELRGFIRAIRKIQELTLLSIAEDVATLSCGDITMDTNGDIIMLDGRIKMSLSFSETESGNRQESDEFTIQFSMPTPHPIIAKSRASSSSSKYPK